MSIRPENTNPVPAVSQDCLDTWEYLKLELRGLKEKAFPEANRYTEQSYSKKAPKGMSPKGLEKEINDILTDEIRLQLTQNYTAARLRLEIGLAEIVIGTSPSGIERDSRDIREKGLLQEWVGKEALVLYSLRVEGRKGKEMRTPYNEHTRWGYAKKQTPIALMKAKEWVGAWKDIVFLDSKVDATDMRPYLPDGSDYLLTTVHKFEAVEENGVGEISLNGRKYIPLDNAVHLRIKSGAEMLWKMIAFLSGIEEKKSGETRDDILDEAAARLICRPGKPTEKQPFGHVFGRKAAYIFKALTEQYHHYPDLLNSVILQELNLGFNGPHRKMFLDTVPKHSRKFLDKILQEEGRPYISINKKAMVLPYYLEMRPRIGIDSGNVFNKNVVDLLIYSKDLYDAMYGMGFDQLAYRARNEGWRFDHYTLFEWLLASKLAPVITSLKVQTYVKDLVSARMKESGLDKL